MAKGGRCREPSTGEVRGMRKAATGRWLTCASRTDTGKPDLLKGRRPVWGRADRKGLGNARHIKAVPGRKTDTKDCEWIADLLRHGLLRGSFIPDQAQRELRDLTRTRTTLTDERSAVVCRLQKVLEDANLKLAGVATDILGASGRAILAALAAGADDPAALAELAKGRLRRKQAELERALTGRLRAHHR